MKTRNESSKFRIKNWVETNDDPRETCTTKSQNKYKTTMLKSSLCDDSNAHLLL